MLSVKEMKNIALEECIVMLGSALVDSHRELCCASYGMLESGLFRYTLGLDTEEKEYHMGKETPMEYYAFVTVNPKTGAVARDYENSILPN